MSFIAAGVLTAGATIWGAVSANKQQKKMEAKEKESRKEMDRLKNIYANLDTSNPFLNMENVMEDLTINQKQAEFQKQQFQQSQANIMQGFKGAAGGSGIASLAQSLAQQGQIAAQKSAASIGQQESRNQALERQEASRIQGLERQGEIQSRNWEREKQSTLLGMSQQETAAYGQQAQAAEQAKWSAISQGVSSFTGMLTGSMGGGGDGGGGGSITNIYTGQGGGTGAGGTGN